MDNEPSLADLILLLLYRTSWEEKSGGEKIFRSWRSYDWDALDELKDKGLIFGSQKAKSVYLTDEAVLCLMELYRMLSHACSYHLFNTENPFSAVDFNQPELLEITLAKF